MGYELSEILRSRKYLASLGTCIDSFSQQEFIEYSLTQEEVAPALLDPRECR